MKTVFHAAGGRKRPLVIALALMLVCETVMAEEKITYGPKLSDAQYAALSAAVGGSVIENPDPPGAGNYHRSAHMSADGVIVARDSRTPGVVTVSYVPGENAASGAFGGNTATIQSQALDNISEMDRNLATMKHDTAIINAAIAQGKNANDSAFREAFEKAEQAANSAVQQPIQNTFVQSVPIKEPPVAKVQEYTAHKPLISLEMKDVK